MKNKKGFTPKLQNSHYEVLKCLQNGLNIREISSYRNVSRRAIYNNLSTLIKKGLVAKVGYGTYELTEEGYRGLHSFVAFRYKLRQHNYGIKLEILNKPRNWEQRRNEFRQLPYFNKSIKLKNNEQDLFNYGRCFVRTTTKSIILKLPTIYAKNWEDAVIQGMSILEDMIPKLEKTFKVKLVKNYKNNMKIISQEYASIQDALAKLYHSEGNRIYLTGEDGKIWLITDFSFSTDELEYIHPNKATDDNDAIAPFLNDLRKNPTTISEVRNDMKQAQELVLSHARNINKHEKVLDKIYEQMLRLEKRLNQLEKKDNI